MITHYQRLLDYIEPDFVHVSCLMASIVKSGDKELAKELREHKGYSWVAEAARGRFKQHEAVNRTGDSL